MRHWLLRILPFFTALSVWGLCLPRPARAFGESGAFDPRALIAGGTRGPAHPNAAARWAAELIERTSAPARTQASQVRADDASIVQGPFLWWSGTQALAPLSASEVHGLRTFFSLGGMLLVDDAGVGVQGSGPAAFGTTAREQLKRVLPDASPISLAPSHSVYKSFYLVRRPVGRISGPDHMDAIVRAGRPLVLFSSHDIGGALSDAQTVVPGGEGQREQAIRLAVNIAMYVLCSNYKDDQVHAPHLMRRRSSALSP